MSRYLLDTQVWLWMLGEPGRMRPEVLTLLTDPDNDVLLSAASGWEIAIKYRLGKLGLPEPPRSFVPDRMRRTGTTALAVEHDLSSASPTCQTIIGTPSTGCLSRSPKR